MKVVYVLQSIQFPERYYTGITESIDRRLIEHNRGMCFHTSKWGPWKVIVSASFDDDEKALRFERYLKSGSGRAFAKRHF